MNFTFRNKSNSEAWDNDWNSWNTETPENSPTKSAKSSTSKSAKKSGMKLSPRSEKTSENLLIDFNESTNKTSQSSLDDSAWAILNN